MRVVFIGFTVVLAGSILGGCTTVSETDYKIGRSYLAENPSFKLELIRDCITGQRRESIGDQKTTAALMGVSVAAYPKLFCSRIINAYSNGRLSYRDITNVSSGSADQSKIIKIVLGR